MLCQSGDTAGSEARLPRQGVEVWLYHELPIERDTQEVKGAPGLDLLAVDVDGEGGGGGFPLPPTITCVFAPLRASPFALM
jgi:hypothetical protein